MRASHIRGAEITYAHVSGTTYEITVQVYIDPDAPLDSGPEIVLYTGDGVDGVVLNVVDDALVGVYCPAYRKTYSLDHTYPGPGGYLVNCSLGNRVGGLANMPGSSDDPLCIEAEIIVGIWGDNTSPLFTNDQTELDHTSDALVHDPMITEADGDSLSFELVVPKGADCEDVPGYMFPAALPPPGDFTTIDPSTGVFTWIHPNMLGYFAIAIKCTEWRDGMAIGRITRDMVLCVGYLPSGVGELNGPSQLSLSPSLALDGRPVEVNLPGARGDLLVLDPCGRLLERVRLAQGHAVLRTEHLATGSYRLLFADSGVTAPLCVVHR